MKLLFGLGNPGKEYEKTRHNIGAGFIDFIVEKQSLNFTKKFNSEIADFKINDEKIILVKPQTFMNNSGTSVSEIKNFYKIASNQIYICFDDLDIREGEFKIQFAKYPKVHNGVNDILQKIKSDQIFFIRIGVDGRNDSEREFLKGSDYVLQKTNFDYEKIYEEIYKQIFAV